jgi:hypothetical protein
MEQSLWLQPSKWAVGTGKSSTSFRKLLTWKSLHATLLRALIKGKRTKRTLSILVLIYMHRKKVGKVHINPQVSTEVMSDFYFLLSTLLFSPHFPE